MQEPFIHFAMPQIDINMLVVWPIIKMAMGLAVTGVEIHKNNLWSRLSGTGFVVAVAKRLGVNFLFNPEWAALKVVPYFLSKKFLSPDHGLTRFLLPYKVFPTCLACKDTGLISEYDATKVAAKAQNDFLRPDVPFWKRSTCSRHQKKTLVKQAKRAYIECPDCRKAADELKFYATKSRHGSTKPNVPAEYDISGIDWAAVKKTFGDGADFGPDSFDYRKTIKNADADHEFADKMRDQRAKLAAMFDVSEIITQEVSNAVNHAGGKPSCPKCGGAMGIRVAKRGERKGQQFWGCNGFPSNCRGIVDIGMGKAGLKLSDSKLHYGIYTASSGKKFRIHSGGPGITHSMTVEFPEKSKGSVDLRFDRELSPGVSEWVEKYNGGLTVNYFHAKRYVFTFGSTDKAVGLRIWSSESETDAARKTGSSPSSSAYYHRTDEGAERDTGDYATV